MDSHWLLLESYPSLVIHQLEDFCDGQLDLFVFPEAQFLQRLPSEPEQSELEELRKEVAYWKFRYGNLVEMKLGSIDWVT